MKKLFLVVLLSSIQYVCFAQPVISSFTPQAALPQSQITITGSGFSAIADSNIVYFGAVKGKVLNATANELAVRVPVGATYSFLSVTKARLTGHSYQFFTPLSNASGYTLDSSSFEDPVTITSTTDLNTGTLKLYDADGDGKTDIIAADTGSSSISFYRNTASAGTINNTSFAPSTFRTTGNTDFRGNYPFALYDVDGDGKKDIAIDDDTAIKLFKNTGTAGNISFDDSTGIAPGKHFRDMAAADIDGDGKIDIACITYYRVNFTTDSSAIKILLNTGSTNGVISFTSLPVIFTQPGSNNGSAISLIDLNGDKKPDLFFNAWNYISGQYYFNSFTAVNVSTPGNVLFEPLTNFPRSPSVQQVRFADIDSDGLTDIVTCNGHDKTISIWRNVSTALNIVFTPPVNIAVGKSVYDVETSDLDGDGKVDLACTGNDWEPYQQFAALFKNASTPGNIIFFPKIEYNPQAFPSSIAAGDMDGDVNQDLVIGFSYAKKIVVMRNKMGVPRKAVVCPSSAADTLTSGITGSNYQWQLCTDSINFFNLTEGADHTGTQTNRLIIHNLHSSMYGYRYRCVADNKYDKPDELIFQNTWTGAVDSSWENPVNWSCNTLPDANTDVIIPNGTAVLGSNSSCRSIKVSPGASLNVLPGFSLTVTH